MNVILINEDEHGQIGIALNYHHAVTWLIDRHWIYDYLEVWNDQLNRWISLKEELGEDWADIMTENWTKDDFNNYWQGDFYLTSEKVIGTEDE